MENYIQHAMKTESIPEHESPVLREQAGEVNALMKVAIALGKQMDKEKRAIFYTEKDTKYDNEVIIKKKSLRIMHALIGLVTEVGELLEAFQPDMPKIMVDGPDDTMDRVNVIEEMGDIQWYLAILHDVFETDFDTTQRINIAKLAERFDDKFDVDSAVIRDVIQERRAMMRK